MNTTTRTIAKRQRSAGRGAVLIVVLIVMTALLGLGMTGLFLTSGSIQMNANINLRNQALVVAESGIERARDVLNSKGWPLVPPIPTLLAGSVSSADEVPSTSHPLCNGSYRGAVLVDQITTGCTGTPCTLLNVPYPSPPFDRVGDLPTSAGLVARSTMGTYTVYIRQDQADCRMGNYTCDFVPVEASALGGAGGSTNTGTSAGAGGAAGITTCTAPSGAPPPNHAIIVRSEGLASDGRTRVVLEVTMTPSQGLVQPANTPLSALCASGASGCDDNSSLQSGIVVNSGAPQAPPAGTGGAGTGGAGTGGATGTGGSGTGGGAPSTGTGGSGSGTGGKGTGGATGTGGSGAGGGGGCVTSSCPLLGVMGVYGNDIRNPTVNFAAFLAGHSSSCVAQNLEVGTNVITDTLLAPYKVIVVLDVGHRLSDYQTLNLDPFGTSGFWNAWIKFSNPSPPVRQFSATEGQVVKNWVQNGGGLLVINGWDDSLLTNPNFNTLIQPFGLIYYSPPCGLTSCDPPGIAYQSVYGEFILSSGDFTAHAVSAGMTTWKLSGYWPISGYPITTGPPSPISSAYTVWAKQAGRAVGVAGPSGSGRIVVVADEWLSYDSTLGPGTYKTSMVKFWDNSVKWLGQCP